MKREGGDSWKEWNGKFRDDVRRFLKGDNGLVTQFVTRLVGSPDLFAHQEREPEQSINFVTCHDGFTLNDLVSYNQKHNEANGEDNRDGSNDNMSWNGGVEGPTDDAAIEAWRKRQIKNFLTVTLLSVGAPMILMGDEVRRTQLGNNNAYCQDNEISWFDWSLLKKNSDLFRFVKILLKHRLKRDVAQSQYAMSLRELLDKRLISWHGVRLNEPDWSEQSHSIAFTVQSLSGNMAMHFMINAYSESLTFELPKLSSDPKHQWKRWIDTSLESPDDIQDWVAAPLVGIDFYATPSYSVVVLIA